MSDGLQLRGDLITTAQLMAAWDVTRQTISNYVARGMPVGGTGKRGRVFDKAACEVWRTNFLAGTRGGKREGAGRKAGNTVETPRGAAVQEPLLDQAGAAGTLTNADVLKLGDVHEIVASFASGKVTPAIARTGSDLLGVALKRMELDKLTGKVVGRTAVVGAMGRHLRNVRLTLETVPRRASQQAASQLRLTADAAAVVRKAMEEELGRALRMLAENPLSEPEIAKAG